MNPLVTSAESKSFVKILLITGLIWMLLGSLIHIQSNEDLLAFIQVYLFSTLDLTFLMLLFWAIFFTSPEQRTQRANKLRVLLFSFFKLVCLGFLAITLKRLRNASASALFMGVAFIWVGPLLSGLILKHLSRFRKN